MHPTEVGQQQPGREKVKEVSHVTCCHLTLHAGIDDVDCIPQHCQVYRHDAQSWLPEQLLAIVQPKKIQFSRSVCLMNKFEAYFFECLTILH